MWYDSYIFVIGLSFICVTELIHTCDTTRSCVTQLFHMCDMTHSYVWNDSFTCVTWLIHIYEMTPIFVLYDSHSYVWHNSYICVIWFIHFAGFICPAVDCVVKICGASWYRVAKTHRMPLLAGYFRKKATNYRALLRKMTYEYKASYESIVLNDTHHSERIFGKCFLHPKKKKNFPKI